MDNEDNKFVQTFEHGSDLMSVLFQYFINNTQDSK